MGSIAKTQTAHFYRDKPVFGFDIGHSSLKVMQIDLNAGKRPRLIGYGTANFAPGAIKDGVIVDHEAIANATLDLFQHRLIGDITTNRVIVSIPAYRTYARSISLPHLTGKELDEAVSLEAEQYIPVPLDTVYLDYNVIGQTADKTDLFAIAAPRVIVDSQLELMEVLGLEVVGVDTTIGSAGRLFSHDPQSDIPTVIIDFGSLTADISIYDNALAVTGTVPGGGEVFTDKIRDRLGVTRPEAQIIKTKYGLGPSKRQAEINEAMAPTLDQLAREIRRMIRYYEERASGKRKINQIMTLGGGANVPGLSAYLTNKLRLPVRTCDPWEYCNYHGLQTPNTVDKPMYATVMGLSMTASSEVFA